MLSKLFVIASIGLAAVNAFQFKDTYPAPFEVPTPKAEWLELIKGVSIANAPVLQVKDGGKRDKTLSYNQKVIKC